MIRNPDSRLHCSAVTSQRAVVMLAECARKLDEGAQPPINNDDSPFHGWIDAPPQRYPAIVMSRAEMDFYCSISAMRHTVFQLRTVPAPSRLDPRMGSSRDRFGSFLK